VLRIAEAAVWLAVKVALVVVAVPLILIYAVATFAVMFAHGAWP